MKKKALTFVMAERLKTLRKEAGYSHQKLSEELRKRYEIKISKDALITYEAPEFHTNAGANDGMSVRYLRCLADFFSVSTDYLLGLTDEATPDMDERAACEYLGLTAEAVRKWRYYIHPAAELEPDKRYSFYPIEMLNSLLTDEYSFACIDDFCTGISDIRKSLKFPRVYEFDTATEDKLHEAFEFLESHGYASIELEKIGRSEATAAAAGMHSFLHDIIEAEYTKAKKRDIEWLTAIRKERGEWQREEGQDGEASS